MLKILVVFERPLLDTAGMSANVLLAVKIRGENVTLNEISWLTATSNNCEQMWRFQAFNAQM